MSVSHGLIVFNMRHDKLYSVWDAKPDADD